MNRRSFLQKTAMAGGVFMVSSLLPKTLLAGEDATTITILHTNDVHSHLEPFPMDGSKWQGMGGVARRAELIKEIRSTNDNVLLLDAGDIFQGTPYFNVYKGEPEIKAMTMMGYDAATMGNHDFDGGLENFATQLKHASFPIIICNYDFTGTVMEGKTVPYKIFDKKGLKIGVFGLGIELQGLVPDNLYGKTVYRDPIESANKTASVLRKEGCDMIICLSHLGDKYNEDKVSDEILAKNTYDVDLIIGGHTHRFFETPRKYTNKNGGDVIVNQVGWAGIQLGRLDFAITKNKKKKIIGNNSISVNEKRSK